MTALTADARPAAPRRGPAGLWHHLRAAAHRRAGRVEWIVLVLFMLAPMLIIAMLGGD